MDDNDKEKSPDLSEIYADPIKTGYMDRMYRTPKEFKDVDPMSVILTVILVGAFLSWVVFGSREAEASDAPVIEEVSEQAVETAEQVADHTEDVAEEVAEESRGFFSGIKHRWNQYTADRDFINSEVERLEQWEQELARRDKELQEKATEVVGNLEAERQEMNEKWLSYVSATKALNECYNSVVEQWPEHFTEPSTQQ